jgi:hypothetical protein
MEKFNYRRIRVIGKYILTLPGNPPDNFTFRSNYPFKKLYGPLSAFLRSYTVPY